MKKPPTKKQPTTKKTTPQKKHRQYNILHHQPTTTHLWQYHTTDQCAQPKTQHTTTNNQLLPKKTTQKTWRQLLQPPHTIAWIPETNLYIRTLKLPKTNPTEHTQILQLQLEKLSPAPTNQITWTHQPLPNPNPNQQTTLLIITQTQTLNQHLQQIEQTGIQPNTLQPTLIHELLNLNTQTDHIWIRLKQHPDNTLTALTAWTTNHTIQHTTLLTIPPPTNNKHHDPTPLIQQLNQTAWTAEIENWLPNNTPPPITLNTPQQHQHLWKTTLQQWTHQPIQTQPQTTPTQLATQTAQNNHKNKTPTNLLPQQHRTRYRQQHTDTLYIKTAALLLLLYLTSLLTYTLLLQYKKHQNQQLQTQLRTASTQYTNTLKLQAKIQILQQQIDLKFSALDCLRIITEELPSQLTLTDFNFTAGKRLNLYGTAQPGQAEQITQYHNALINAQNQNQKLFAQVHPPNINTRRNQTTWNFTCELQQTGF